MNPIETVTGDKSKRKDEKQYTRTKNTMPVDAGVSRSLGPNTVVVTIVTGVVRRLAAARQTFLTKYYLYPHKSSYSPNA